MIEVRKQQILAQMTALRKERYSSKDMLQEAMDFEHELYRATFAGKDIDKPRFSDVINRLRELDIKAGGIVTDKINELSELLDPLGEQISICLAGGSGESKVFNLLKTLKCSNILLRNVELTADQMHCEIDLLVITPKVVLCIEVKNNKYDTLLDANGNLVRMHDGKIYERNLGERIRWREHILRMVLTRGMGEDSTLPDIKTYVVSANPKIRFANEFQFVDCCCYTVIANVIEENLVGSVNDKREMEFMEQIIRSAIDIHEYPLGIDVTAIRLMFADILATLEYATEIPISVGPTSSDCREMLSSSNTKGAKYGKFFLWMNKAKTWLFESSIPRYAGSVLVGAFVGGMAMKFKYDNGR